jgi:hypothetical protein
MTPQISKEAMEKAKGIISLARNQFRENFNANQLFRPVDFIEREMALEFTNYQKRIDELEELVKEAARLSPARSDMRPDHQMQILRDKAKSHLAKGVKEEG